ncbi:MAG: leucine-rich repeat domain-containing protein [Clostridiales bacterium]|nr:leucine-rich repeat domain-containing protein [Clostridiales bacterium]
MSTMKKLFSVTLSILMVLSAIPLVAAAETSEDGYLTYTVKNGEATITDCDTSISGDYVIPDTLGGYPVTSIGSYKYNFYVFSGCTSVTSITIPDGVTIIGNYAFYGCSSLESITVPDSVEFIGSRAFYGCTALTSINIPANVTSIGYLAFWNCDSLEKITVDDDNQYYSSDDYGVLFDKNKTEIIWVPNGSSTASYSIPDGVATIDEYAFYSCKFIESIIIPGSVSEIGDYAFYGCEALADISISEGVTSIGVRAFQGCTSLESITIPDSVSSIGDSAFSGCTSLKSTSIGTGVTAINYGTFGGCSSLENIVIPSTVTEIGNSAFSYCTSLTSISIPDSVTTIGASAFYNCTALTHVDISEYVTSIGYRAFRSCDALEKITVDENNQYYTSDEYGVLFNKNKTELIHFPKGAGIASYSIPDGVISIDDSIFSFCTSLESITIPGSVTSIYDFEFEECTSLKSITVSEDNEYYSSDEYGVLFNKDKTVIIAFPEGSSLTSYSIPDGVEIIDYGAFYLCGSLENIYLPNSVTTIRASGFFGCTSLKEIIIPEGVTEIQYYAFHHCTSLQSVTISESVMSIGEFAFASCPSLTSVIIPDSVTEIDRGAFGLVEGIVEDEAGDYWGYNAVDGFTVYGYSTGTAAEAYAEEYGFTFMLVEDDVETPEEDCSHFCHSESSFVQFFYKIICFMWKLFGINQYCECGAAHW